MFPLIANAARNLSNYIKSEISKDELKAFEARDFTTRFTSDVIYSCLFGVDAKSFEMEDSPMFNYGKKFLRGVIISLVSVIPLKMMTKNVEEFYANFMKDAMNLRLERKLAQDDMLTHAISLKQIKKFTDLEVLGHCMTIFLNSFETSAVTIQNMLYQLAKNPKVQEKLRAEINEKIKTNEDFTYENISELLYLDQVFYETLRLHPGLVFTTRVSTEDIEMKAENGKNFKLKKNSAIWIPIHSIHRDSGETLCAQRLLDCYLTKERKSRLNLKTILKC